MQLALAMSREEHDEEEKRKKQDDLKLQMALEESQKEAPLQSNADTLLDLSATAAALSSPSGGDPWDSSAQHQATAADPWGGNSKPVPAADPWGATPPPAAQATTAPPDPWASPATSSAQPTADPWGNGGVPSNGTVSKGLDDEFDMLSSRSKSPQTAATGGLGNNITASPSLTNNNTSSSNNPWDMDILGESLQPTSSSSITATPVDMKKSKSPEQFLGTHANLVNLDNLVTKPAAPSSTNPFALTNPGAAPAQPQQNPFANQQQQQSAERRVPLNKMTTSSSMGFPGASATPPPTGTFQPSPAFGQPGGLYNNAGGSPAFGQPYPAIPPSAGFPQQPPQQVVGGFGGGQMQHQSTNNPFL